MKKIYRKVTDSNGRERNTLAKKYNTNIQSKYKAMYRRLAPGTCSLSEITESFQLTSLVDKLLNHYVSFNLMETITV